MTRHSLFGLLAGLLAGVAVVGVVLLLGNTSRNTDETADLAAELRAAQAANTRTLELIESCTIRPSGRCARLQAESREQFSRLITLAAYCADQPYTQTVAQIERCIREGITDE